MPSEIARIRQQIQLEYEACYSGLHGLASGVSRHDFITAKQERIGELHEKLAEIVGSEAAIALVAQSVWSPEDYHPIATATKLEGMV